MSTHVDMADNGSTLDFSSIEELDPSLTNGFRTIYDREVPFEVRTKTGDERAKQGTLELLKVKILLAGIEESPSIVRVELSSESDLFFHYMHIVDEKEFLKIQDSQKLVVDFIDYATVLIRMLNACIKEPHIHLAILTIFTDQQTNGRIDFIQNMEYKFVELMYCNCIRSPEEIVQNHITFRYNAMKQKLNVVHNRLQELTNLVKVKNPSLLLQLQKHHHNGGASTAGTGTGGLGPSSNASVTSNTHHHSGHNTMTSLSGSSHNLKGHSASFR